MMTPSDNGIKILLVEDDKYVRDMLQQTLSRASYVVLTAKDGEHALQILKTFTPDVVVTDIIMPRKSGTELIAELKSINPENPIKIIAISGGGRADPIGYLDLSEELGALFSFAKPIDHSALIMTIKLLTKDIVRD
jgi:CheY-like chemotaxis protein